MRNAHNRRRGSEWKRSTGVACALALAGLLGCPLAPPETAADVQLVEASMAIQPLDLDTASDLDAAFTLYDRGRLERFRYATDPFERFETMFQPLGLQNLVNTGAWGTLFIFADESFEAERDYVTGFGQGPRAGPNLPATVQRIHLGERGGLDSSSCRSCHFAGGPDGAGTLTQIALLRGDGQHLSSATQRDAPHVMGLGYIELVAAAMTEALHTQRDSYIYTAELTFGETPIDELEPFVGQLMVDDIDFGSVVIEPNRTVIINARGVSDDLVVRPFGHKGRFAKLPNLIDEALQIHHGQQSTSRLFAYAEDAEAYLGNGPELDRDEDGIENEVSEAQPVALATYLSMLSIPVIRPPKSPDLQAKWARGSALLDSVGCTQCHIRRLNIQDDTLVHRETGEGDLAVSMSLLNVALDPKPVNLDFGDPISGVPFFPFTDLRRHNMGEALADDHAEVLPDGSGIVPGSFWLTRSLWGLADTGPYLHDGRARTVHDAILMHGGEALNTVLAYLALPDEDKASLRVFLLSLTRPPTVLVE